MLANTSLLKLSQPLTMVAVSQPIWQRWSNLNNYSDVHNTMALKTQIVHVREKKNLSYSTIYQKTKEKTPIYQPAEMLKSKWYQNKKNVHYFQLLLQKQKAGKNHKYVEIQKQFVSISRWMIKKMWYIYICIQKQWNITYPCKIWDTTICHNMGAS